MRVNTLYDQEVLKVKRRVQPALAVRPMNEPSPSAPSPSVGIKDGVYVSGSGLTVKLSVVEEKRIRLILELTAVQGEGDPSAYRAQQAKVAQELGKSVRSVRRMQQRYRELGIEGLLERPRTDKGQRKISDEWQQFIVKTYREGNRDGRKLSPLQVSVRVQVRAMEAGQDDYPSHMTVYRVLASENEKAHRPKRSLGWRGSQLVITTREGQEIDVRWPNQIWQADHTKVDVLLVDSSGVSLGRPWLTLIIDTFSRCIMGMHLGFDAPSADIVCLALRHAILPKHYPAFYDLRQLWGTYGVPQYLYTDSGQDFRSHHLDQVTLALGILPCLRRKPSDGGIIERPFGTLNSELFATLPGYTGGNVSERSPQAEASACLTLLHLEQLLVRYIVDNYNQGVDARMENQSRIERWEADRSVPLRLLGERELDICLLRRERRTIYRSGYLQFANLTYQGEHLAAYAGESVVIRYDPRDITTIWVYQHREGREHFLSRAHAQGWETEVLSYAEAKALSQRRRQSGQSISNRSLLEEVRDRDSTVKKLRRQSQNLRDAALQSSASPSPDLFPPAPAVDPSILPEPEVEAPPIRKPVPYVRVLDLEELRRRAGLC